MAFSLLAAYPPPRYGDELLDYLSNTLCVGVVDSEFKHYDKIRYKYTDSVVSEKDQRD